MGTGRTTSPALLHNAASFGRRRRVRLLIPAASVSLLAACSCASEATTDSRPGYVTTSADDPLVNRCAVDPIGDLERRIDADPAYVLAYRSGMTTSCADSAASAPYVLDADEPETNHRQSIQRLQRGDESFLVVSHAVPPAGETAWDPGFEIVAMGAHDAGGGALGAATGITATSDAPACDDRVVGYVGFPLADLRHAGGMQVSGHHVVVAFEDRNDEAVAAFATASLEDPGSPRIGPTVHRQGGDLRHAGIAASTRLSDGRFLVIVFGWDATDAEVFVSAATTMPATADEWRRVGDWSVPFGALPRDAYQNVQLVTECSDEGGGALHAVATGRERDGDDRVDLWRVALDLETLEPTFILETTRTLRCEGAATAGAEFCDFDAGAGAYVDPTGALLLYGVEPYNDFPIDGSPPDLGVRVREFAVSP